MKDRIVKNIPTMDLMSFLLETTDSPKHVGGLQIYQANKGEVATTIDRILSDYHSSPVSPPFNYRPVFPKPGLPLNVFGRAKWVQCDVMDMSYHIRQIAVPAPGTQKQLLDLVSDLHAGVLDRSRPCWILYIIEGLENDQFALYSKVQHAYIDGASAVMRMDAALAKSPTEKTATPMWAPIEKREGKKARKNFQQQWSELAKNIILQRRAVQDVAKNLFKTAMTASGIGKENHAPLPFTAPKSMFNTEVYAQRRLGVGSISLADLKQLAKSQNVSINELVLTLVGAALEDYSLDYSPDKSLGKSLNKTNTGKQHRLSAVGKPLVAVCPMAMRKEGDTTASTQIAALAIKLGEPGVSIEQRLQQVQRSSTDAKADAQAMSREALMAYLVLVGGLAELLDRPPFTQYLPPLTNVNVSNVRGPEDQRYLCGAKLLKNIPVSTLAGGTAVNITFLSMVDQMEFAVIADALAVPDAQRIADNIATAFKELQRALLPSSVKAASKERARKKPVKRPAKKVVKKTAVKLDPRATRQAKQNTSQA